MEDNIVEINPYFLAGLESILDEDLEQALKNINLGLEIEPKNAVGWAYKARILNLMERNEESVNAWEKSVKFAGSKNYYAVVNLATSLTNCKRNEEAIVIEEKLLKKLPNDLLLLTNFSIGVFNLGKYEKAVEISRHIIKIAKKENIKVFPRVWENFCNSLYLLDRFEEAEKNAIEGLKDYPDNAYLLTGIGQILVSLGKSKESLQFFDKSLSIKPKDDETWIEKATAYVDLNETQRALDCLLVGVSLNPEQKQEILENGMFSKLKDNSEFQRIINL